MVWKDLKIFQLLNKQCQQCGRQDEFSIDFICVSQLFSILRGCRIFFRFDFYLIFNIWIFNFYLEEIQIDNEKICFFFFLEVSYVYFFFCECQLRNLIDEVWSIRQYEKKILRRECEVIFFVGEKYVLFFFEGCMEF